VKIEINHTYQEDLSISLVHPNGTRVLVIEAEGRNESVDVISKEITDFNGTDVKGNWTLEVRDLAKNDEGQLVKWSLEGKLKAE
jgi:endonuclease G